MRFRNIPLLVTLATLLLLLARSGASVRVAKITDGLDKLVADRGSELPHSEPDPFYGPESLRVMLGTCFSKSV